MSDQVLPGAARMTERLAVEDDQLERNAEQLGNVTIHRQVALVDLGFCVDEGLEELVHRNGFELHRH